MSAKCKIKVCKDGPYIVHGGLPLTRMDILWDAETEVAEWGSAKELPHGEQYSLCRCGHSRSKPFCDKSHAEQHFDGTEKAHHPPYKEQAKRIDGPKVELLDAEGLCASARFCHPGGGIWKLVPESDDPVKRALAVEEGRACPSGRLVVRDKSTGKEEEPALEPSIVVIEDPSIGVGGPLWVRGGVPIESVDGKTYEIRNRVTLCRCGKSKSKPFCDSSHWPE